MYQSPISLIQKDVESKIDDAVMMTVQKVGVEVDKDELLCALMYDRKQYEKGYRDGLSDAVKRGKWMHDKNDCLVSGYCSVCGWQSIICETDVADMPFCPNCGAKMDGGEG